MKEQIIALIKNNSKTQYAQYPHFGFDTQTLKISEDFESKNLRTFNIQNQRLSIANPLEDLQKQIDRADVAFIVYKLEESLREDYIPTTGEMSYTLRFASITSDMIRKSL